MGWGSCIAGIMSLSIGGGGLVDYLGICFETGQHLPTYLPT